MKNSELTYNFTNREKDRNYREESCVMHAVEHEARTRERAETRCHKFARFRATFKVFSYNENWRTAGGMWQVICAACKLILLCLRDEHVARDVCTSY
jgi:hypothetical protein